MTDLYEAILAAAERIEVEARNPAQPVRLYLHPSVLELAREYYA